MMYSMLSSSIVLLSCVQLAHGYTLDDGTGKLPALGWSTWNAYQCGITADKIVGAANTMTSKGFKKAGYNYVNIDDCWSIKSGRDNTTHEILPDLAKFPKGIKGVADELHQLGFKVGIYSSAGVGTCAGYPGSLGYEEVDAATFNRWGIDYLKYDNCGYPSYWFDSCYACNADPLFSSNLVNGTCTNETQTTFGLYQPLCAHEWPVDGRDYSQSRQALRYQIMQNALEAQNRTILYSLCEWGMNEPWTWGNKTAQSWRMSNDIQPNWDSVTNIINLNSFLSNFADFGGHNDPDMLEVGNGDLTVEETRTHFALWAIMKAPLIIGTDLDKLSQANINILLNKHLLAFNQDPIFGKPAAPYKWGVNPDYTFNSTNPAEFWSGVSSKGTMVAMVNTLNETRTMTAVFDEIPGLSENSYRVINAWTGKNMGCRKGSVKMTLGAHDTAVLLLKDTCAGVTR